MKELRSDMNICFNKNINKGKWASNALLLTHSEQKNPLNILRARLVAAIQPYYEFNQDTGKPEPRNQGTLQSMADLQGHPRYYGPGLLREARDAAHGQNIKEDDPRSHPMTFTTLHCDSRSYNKEMSNANDLVLEVIGYEERGMKHRMKEKMQFQETRTALLSGCTTSLFPFCERYEMQT